VLVFAKWLKSVLMYKARTLLEEHIRALVCRSEGDALVRPLSDGAESRKAHRAKQWKTRFRLITVENGWKK
jgi:hypothetical protein